MPETLRRTVPYPPANERPVEAGGAQFTLAWARYFQRLSDAVNALAPTDAGGGGSAAGDAGDYLEVTLEGAPPVALTTDVAADVLTLPLTPGDWDVSGSVSLELDSSSATAVARWGIDGLDVIVPSGTYVTLVNLGGWTGPRRYNVTAPTTPVALRVNVTFTDGTATVVAARLMARRMR